MKQNNICYTLSNSAFYRDNQFQQNLPVSKYCAYILCTSITHTHMPRMGIGSFFLMNYRLPLRDLSRWCSAELEHSPHFSGSPHDMRHWPKLVQKSLGEESNAQKPGTSTQFPAFPERNFRYNLLIWMVLLLFRVHPSNLSHICDCLAELGAAALSSVFICSGDTWCV